MYVYKHTTDLINTNSYLSFSTKDYHYIVVNTMLNHGNLKVHGPGTDWFVSKVIFSPFSQSSLLLVAKVDLFHLASRLAKNTQQKFVEWRFATSRWHANRYPKQNWLHPVCARNTNTCMTHAKRSDSEKAADDCPWHADCFSKLPTSLCGYEKGKYTYVYTVASA